MTEVYLSREGLQKLRDELRQLRTEERPKVRQALQRAREFGDLSENAEYSAAKERLMFLEQRISRLEETLSRARPIEAEDIPDDKVYIGATVQLSDLGRGGELSYTLVSPEEADFEQGKISTVSPIGQRPAGQGGGGGGGDQGPRRRSPLQDPQDHPGSGCRRAEDAGRLSAVRSPPEG